MQVKCSIDYHKELIHDVVSFNEKEPHIVIRMKWKLRTQTISAVFISAAERERFMKGGERCAGKYEDTKMNIRNCFLTKIN